MTFEKVQNLTFYFVLEVPWLGLCYCKEIFHDFINVAWQCKNYLMLGFLLAELIRLLGILMIVATWLLVLKQNTMDIGLLIGASVAGGFFLCKYIMFFSNAVSYIYL